jgi:PAS domain S-box-containing protein
LNKPAADVMVEAADCSLFKQAASFHEEIIRSAGDAILGEDLSGKIVLWNGGAERLYGYSQVEAVGLSRITLVPPDKREGEASVRARIAQGERVASYETVRRRKDGSLVEVSITVSPIRNSIGRLVGLSWIARDITERRRTEDQQQLLISEMSHRVKNLFSIAQSLVHLSARSAETPKALADDVSCRFAALARAHALTAPLTNDPGAEQIVMLRELIDAIVAPYVGGAHRLRSRIVINHGALPVGGTAVTSFALRCCSAT